MNKAKILLFAIGLCGTIGSALAFKAQHRFSGTFWCTTIKGGIPGVNALPYTTTLPTQGPGYYCTRAINVIATVYTFVVRSA